MRLFDEICRRGCIKDTDITALKRWFQNNGGVTDYDIDAMFELHRACPVQHWAWSEFFQRTVSDYIVAETEPAGYLTTIQAMWLMTRLSDEDGTVTTKLELDLLRAIIEQARWVPATLVRFALEQILRAVDTGRGPLRGGHTFDAGRIMPAEVGWVREVLLGYGADSRHAITEPELGVVLAINDALAGESAEAQWSDLVAKVLVDALMTSSAYASGGRVVLLTSDFSLELGAGDPTAASMGALPSTFADVMRLYRPTSREDLVLERLERQRIEIITGEPVAMPHVDVLAARYGRERPLTSVERAVLAAFAHAGPQLPQVLGDVVRRAA